jgi:hypothetical protein
LLKIKCLTRNIIRYKFLKAATSFIAKDLTRYINDNADFGGMSVPINPPIQSSIHPPFNALPFSAPWPSFEMSR